MLIEGALAALPAIATRQAKWRIPATAHIAFKRTGLALALIALTSTRLVAITRITTAHAEDAEVLHPAEGRELVAPFMGDWIT